MIKTIRFKEARHTAEDTRKWNIDKIQAACCILLSATVNMSLLYWLLR